MKGLEISRKFYNEYGKSMLETNFPTFVDKIAVGLIGAGSECFGYDDNVSTDHDFDPGFIIFIPDDFGEDIVFKLQRAYAKLPMEFMGYKREVMSPVGGSRRGVKKVSQFLLEKTGTFDGNLTNYDFIRIPEEYLAELTNGEIWRDDNKIISKIRTKLLVMPRDAKLKKLAGELLLMAQSGQYNFKRCIDHGEIGAAKFAIYEFVNSTMHATFLLNEVYMPYYKWMFRAFRDLSWPNNLLDNRIKNDDSVNLIKDDWFRNKSFEEKLVYLLNLNDDEIKSKSTIGYIEMIASIFVDRLKNEELSDKSSNYLEPHAYAVNNKIKDIDLRNANILMAV